MKIIEKISPNVKKCYAAPEVKIFGVEEECILAGGSPITGKPTDSGQGQGDGGNAFGGGGAKQFSFGPIDDEETEY